MASAWAGLADCYSMLAVIDGMPAGDALRKARLAAQNALKIDDTLAEAHASLALLSAIHEYDWPGNYYWRKEGTNQVAGTDTWTRPDIDFTPLKEW